MININMNHIHINVINVIHINVVEFKSSILLFIFSVSHMFLEDTNFLLFLPSFELGIFILFFILLPVILCCVILVFRFYSIV